MGCFFLHAILSFLPELITDVLSTVLNVPFYLYPLGHFRDLFTENLFFLNIRGSWNC